MQKYDKIKQNKLAANEKKRNISQSTSRTSTKQLHGGRQDNLSLSGTSFNPQKKKHLEMLSATGSIDEMAKVLSQLQQTYGNKYVQSLIASTELQAKLNISQPGDFREQQADRVAEVVSRMAETEIQRQPEEEEEEIPQITLLQRQEEEEEEIPSPPEEEEVLSKLMGNQSAVVSGALEESINNASKGGQVLSEVARKPMERAFGVDFNDVRIHTDGEADNLNKSLQARAFTKENDIFFRQGEYNPDSGDGRKLLAHELTHVVQQTKGDNYVNRMKNQLDLQAKSETPEGKRIPVMTLPDPATMGGVVTVKSQKFEAWINPGEPACILGGIRAHEAKHISDFEADTVYSKIPTSGTIADGHCVYYKNNADAKKFENAAIDVEVAWLQKQLDGNPPEADKTIIKRRKDVTLPAYRASFG